MELFANFYDNENVSLEDYNFTAPSFDNEHSQLSPVTWVALILYSLVFLAGVLGNGAVIWVMGFQMRHTVNSVWFLNLAVADLICCLALPILASSLVSEWLMGDFPCKLFPSLTILNMFASVLLLMVISVDRCALVVKTVWCQNHRSVALAWKLCGVAWGFALLLTIPTFITRRTNQDIVFKDTRCVVDYATLSDNSHAGEVAVVVTRFLFAFFIPFMVISICYGLLICRVRSSRFMRSKKTLKVVLVVIVSFFVCWAPYHMTALILASEPSVHTSLYQSVNHVDPLTVGLAYINSCINPIIYVIAGQDFKTKMAKSLKAVLRNVLSEDVTLANSLAEGHAQTTCTTTEDRSTSTNV